MENYSLLMGAAVMKMAVEMAAVSMEKPSGALPRSGGAGTETLSPDLGFAMAAALEGFAYHGFLYIINNVAWNIRNYRYVGDVSASPSLVLLVPSRREMNHIATGTAPSLNGELLPPHGSSSGDEDGGGDGSGVDGEAFRGTSPSGRVPEQRLLSPDLGFAMAAARKVSRTVAFSVRVFDAGALNRRRGGAEG
ncbi:hypothetical protein QYE76_032063 [Lolium multiflorum]|uniref:Uncharacterized protein n=1 Tax=Lolium multiflorum TaxID=4521 RepID=A0AAD8VKS9_LOLMU|nr:hypothetical protein QYE76_032063 [Lolium multiflorum]